MMKMGTFYIALETMFWYQSSLEIPSKAIFEDIPVEAIYTLAMDVPTAWLVRPREALYDLDNIQLGKLFPGDTFFLSRQPYAIQDHETQLHLHASRRVTTTNRHPEHLRHHQQDRHHYLIS